MKLRLWTELHGGHLLPNRQPLPLVAGEQINTSWSIDFMSDALWDGRQFHTFNVIDYSVAKHLPLRWI